jgi:RNA polymerase sigma factor (TIGR02999 family)
LPYYNTVNAESHDVTQLLKRWQLGDDDAPARLMPLVYEELRQLAHNYMQQERADHRPQTTTPVREAYLRMVDDKSLTWKDRAHFYGIAARLLRRILVEQGRIQPVAKRSGLAQKVALNGARDLPGRNGFALAAFNHALESFEQIYPRKSEVVELKFFGGLNTKEISEVLGISEETVLRDWNFAKLWLYRELNGNGA